MRGHDELRRAFLARLAAVDSSRLAADDARALGIMRLALDRGLTSLTGPDRRLEPHPAPARLRVRFRSDRGGRQRAGLPAALLADMRRMKS